VVVSRWFGGIQLGPKLFAHITAVARETLDLYHDTVRGPAARQKK
jgi:putative IMPACT (imprinted ancient) family translation regulator